MTTTATTAAISFQTQLYKLGTLTILRLPADASAQLPSRGQVVVEGTLNGAPFKTPLEPDGKWSHWVAVDADLAKAADVAAGDNVKVVMTATKDWPEPTVPADLRAAIAAADPKIQELWKTITPMARWEWVRWTRSTSNDETRARRIGVAISKMSKGERRPCCWNRNLCTDPSVSKNGVLLDA